MGVIHHASHPDSSISSKQSQADVLLAFTKNLSTSSLKWQYHHIYSHMDDTSEFKNLSLPEQLNVMADKLAQEALLEAMETSRFCKPLYPNEHLRIFIDDKKATTSIKTALYNA